MSLRFQPDRADDAALPPPELVDPEAPDSSEQEFSASLESPAPRFIVDEDAAADTVQKASSGEATAEGLGEEGPVAPSDQPTLLGGPLPDPDAWRQEISARVSSYRAKRKPHVPRYPSLQLRFDPPPPIADRAPMPMASRHSMAVESVPAPADAEIPSAPQAPEPTARILEFPRAVIVPPRPLDELAEPVFDRPRILEAPELVPPPPALGGMLIEAPEQPPVDDRRPGIEVPLRSASMSRRLAATALDGLLVLLAGTLFGYIFFRITGFVPPTREVVVLALALSAIFWAGYQFLLLVYAGTTPGLRLARLKLERFDGSAVPRKLRRWRVLASVLSGLSLGLGYAWFALDEDALCWHDRATHTHMAHNPR